MEARRAAGVIKGWTAAGPQRPAYSGRWHIVSPRAQLVVSVITPPAGFHMRGVAAYIDIRQVCGRTDGRAGTGAVAAVTSLLIHRIAAIVIMRRNVARRRRCD